jgi:hypothetical protein
MTTITQAKITKSRIKLATRTGEGIETDADTLAGLAVHPQPNGKNLFAITHIASGKAFAWFPSKMKARRALRTLAEFCDWTLPESELNKVMDQYNYQRLRQTIRGCGGF